ncbi:hypothetical protein [Fibrobacter sp. UWB11]|jgi:hypothetical protein|uniref:hypothetical protein n=1 Tax=Fibrobacter sp. UWB11 TaxID=1896202 RepID=UPI000928188F|nr:hypothetical protein [Fibrobacter sp. UWB11]SIN92659.1 hypothetical protein SAMN05720758_0612 [Fibrobacter sp. UWB11]
MAIIFDDSKSINDYLKKPESHPESFASLCKRQATGLKLVSDEMEQDRKEQEEMAKLRKMSYERKYKLFFENIDLIMRHRDEILSTPRYANIDAHYALGGGGCYIGPISTSRRYSFAGTLVNINLKLGALLELWDTDTFRVGCKCGGTAVIRYFSGSPLSGASVAAAACPKCKEVLHGIRSRSFGDYMGTMLTKLAENTEKVIKDIIAKWTLAEAECVKKNAEGKFSRSCRPGGEIRGEEPACSLETMINELRLKEFGAD